MAREASDSLSWSARARGSSNSLLRLADGWPGSGSHVGLTSPSLLGGSRANPAPAPHDFGGGGW
eukprot:6337280-Pyramimonas_sp.AAC.1